MSIVLPTKPAPIERVNPKILLLYGPPKVGKTRVLSELPDNLIIDAEDGAAYYECLKVSANSTSDFDKVYDLIMDEGRKRNKEGKKGLDLYPYKYISIDTVDALEDMCETSATKKYKETVMGKSFEGTSILELPNGAGYGLLRKEVMRVLLLLSKVCTTLIVISHVKDKLVNKGGVEVSSKELSLMGKLGSIVCSKADAIGYMYRAKDSTLRVNFVSMESGTTVGGRCPHLLGQDMPFDWKNILVDPK